MALKKRFFTAVSVYSNFTLVDGHYRKKVIIFELYQSTGEYRKVGFITLQSGANTCVETEILKVMINKGAFSKARVERMLRAAENDIKTHGGPGAVATVDTLSKHHGETANVYIAELDTKDFYRESWNDLNEYRKYGFRR